jgi:Putative Actinobacterial Holin-X, holin superfamily III
MAIEPNSPQQRSSGGTVHRLPSAEPHPESLTDRLLKLLKLQVELGVAEVKQTAKSALVAVAVALVALIALIASVVVLFSGAVAAIGGAVWGPLVLAGGGVTLISLAALGWSIWRLRHLKWPSETVATLKTNSRWLQEEVASTLTIPRPWASSPRTKVRTLQGPGGASSPPARGQ